MHWAACYIGLPYERGGRGPRGVDCWGLLRLIYAFEFRISLPFFPGVESDALLASRTIEKETMSEWVLSDQPFDGAAVGLSQRSVLHHVGIYTPSDGGKIIHCWRSHNVIADTGEGLRLKGFKRIEFYRHRLWPTS